MSLLPDGFSFSQASLQDFEVCRRRFYLRYVLGLRWPASPAEPIDEHERRVRMGTEFHRLAQQHLLGVPVERLASSSREPELEEWWQSYLTTDPVAKYSESDGRATIRTEVSLMAPLAGYRLMARYDVLVVSPGDRAVVLDWKTSDRPPNGVWLRERLQSRVYPYVLVAAGAHLNAGEPIEPRTVDMVYWYPCFPDQAVRLPYSSPQHEENQRYLIDLVTTIAELGEDAFVRSDDERVCLYCSYRSYCDRGERAGDLFESPDELDLAADPDDFDLDLEQIAEIEF